MARRPKTLGPTANVSIPKTKRIPRVVDPVIADAGPLSWKFKNTDIGGPFAWSRLSDPEKVAEVVGKLREFEGKHWEEIIKGGSHPIAIHKLEKSARDRLQKLKLDEFDELMSFRLTGANRAWAYWLPEQQNVMRLLWWDPKHQVCRAEKDKADRRKRKRR